MNYDDAYKDTMSSAYGGNGKGGNPYGNESEAYKKSGNIDEAYRTNNHYQNNSYYNQFGSHIGGANRKGGKSIKGTLALLSIVAIGIVYILYFS